MTVAQRLHAFARYTGEIAALAPSAPAGLWTRIAACWLLLRSYAPRLPGPVLPLWVRRQGRAVRVHVQTYGDLDVLHELYVRNEYAAVALPERADVVVDAGANIGLSAIDLRLRYPGARLLAVEPDPRSHALLRRNVAALGDVETVQVALADRDGEAEFFTSDTSVVAGLAPTTDGQRRITVKTQRLGSFLDAHGIAELDLLKLDVEGGEDAVLADGAAVARVRAIVGELHPGLLGRSASAFCDERLAAFDVELVERPRVEGPERLFSARRRA